MATLEDRSRRPVRMTSAEDQQRNRKPSYVGLSCTVSGYSSFIRYSSPDGRKFGSPPAQIPVSSNPQTLDSVSLVLNQDLSMRKMKSDDTMGNGHDVTDDSSAMEAAATAAACKGNLVQKQIERLYGSKVQQQQTIHMVTSSSSTSSSEERKGGFFSMRFGLTKQRDRHTANDSKLVEEKSSLNNNNNPLEFKPLKVPAVFRLLRPEFREQLKSHSCQIPNDQTSLPRSSPGKERVIPIKREGGERVIPINKQESPEKTERIIPVQRDVTAAKPALPTKPLSPSGGRQLQQATHSVRSPALVSSCLQQQQHDREEQQRQERVLQEEQVAIQQQQKQQEEELQVKVPEEPVVVVQEPATNGILIDQEHVANGLEVIGEVADDDVEAEAALLNKFSAGVGGVHEVGGLLSTIMEEDNESNTSGSLLNLSATSVNGILKSNGSKGIHQEDEEPVEVQDGHYFIKLLENEIFKLEELICDFEEDMNNMSIQEDIRENILAAVGKAKLLMAQKLMQFRGLCDKNITLNVEQDPFVPTGQDLAGFWDMVYIQVEHIHALFAELVQLRNNGWKRIELPKSNGSPAENGDKKMKPKRISPKVSTATPKTSPAASEAAKARNEVRRKMMEEKKRLLKEQQEKNGGGDLFVQF